MTHNVGAMDKHRDLLEVEVARATGEINWSFEDQAKLVPTVSTEYGSHRTFYTQVN